MLEEIELYQILENHIKNFAEKENYNRNHIFYDIKKMIKDSLSENQLIDVYYNFDLYEKCLNLSRNNKQNLADYWVNYATKSYNDLTEKLKDPLGLLYFPMVAYNHYVKKEYEIAISYLKRELDIIENYIADNALKIEFKLEQLINLYRISFSKNDYKEIENYANCVFSFAILNKSKNIFFTKKDSLSLLDVTNQKMWIDYVINSILIKLIKNEDDILLKKIFKKLKKQNLKNANIVEFKSIIKVILADIFIKKDFYKVIKNLDIYPDYLQFIILNKLKVYFKEDTRLINVINSYMMILKIEIS